MPGITRPVLYPGQVCAVRLVLVALNNLATRIRYRNHAAQCIGMKVLDCLRPGTECPKSDAQSQREAHQGSHGQFIPVSTDGVHGAHAEQALALQARTWMEDGHCASQYIEVCGSL